MPLALLVRCVRTIVVWKLEVERNDLTGGAALRENHSGMETCAP